MQFANEIIQSSCRKLLRISFSIGIVDVYELIPNEGRVKP